MSIAAKCTCCKSAYCTGGEGCHNTPSNFIDGQGGEGKAELLPCPFCGGTETKEQRTGSDDECTFIQCIKCEAGGPTVFPTRQYEDHPTWNTRLSSPSPVQSAEEYEPYGPEWEKEIMKLPKAAIISMAASLGKRSQSAPGVKDVVKKIAVEFAKWCVDIADIIVKDGPDSIDYDHWLTTPQYKTFINQLK